MKLSLHRWYISPSTACFFSHNRVIDLACYRKHHYSKHKKHQFVSLSPSTRVLYEILHSPIHKIFGCRPPLISNSLGNKMISACYCNLPPYEGKLLSCEFIPVTTFSSFNQRLALNCRYLNNRKLQEKKKTFSQTKYYFCSVSNFSQQ